MKKFLSDIEEAEFEEVTSSHSVSERSDSAKSSIINKIINVRPSFHSSRTNTVLSENTAPSSGKTVTDGDRKSLTKSSSNRSKGGSSTKTKKIVVQVDQDTLEEIIRHSSHGSDFGSWSDGSDCPKDNYHLTFCCSCCCDLRTGVMIANGMAAAVMLMILCYAIFENTMGSGEEPHYDLFDDDLFFLGDEVGEFLDDDDRISAFDAAVAAERHFDLNVYLRNAIGILVALLCGIGGAWKFNYYLVLAAAVGFVGLTAWAWVFGRHAGAVGFLLMIYPNVQLCWVFYTGRLTRENFAIRRQCCIRG